MQRARDAGLVATSDTTLVSLGCLWGWIVQHATLHPHAVTTLLEQEAQLRPGGMETQCYPSSRLAFGCAGCSSSPQGYRSSGIARHRFGLTSQNRCAAVVQTHTPEPT